MPGYASRLPFSFVSSCLRLVFSEQGRVFLKVGYDGFQMRVVVVNHDAEEQFFAFNFGMSLADSKTVFLCMAFKPVEEKTVAGLFPSVACVAHVEQNLQV